MSPITAVTEGFGYIQIMYGGKDKESLCKLRYRKYLEMCCKGIIEPEKMPLTGRSAFLHGLRVSLQIFSRKMLEDDEVLRLDSKNWGCKYKNATMMPVKTDKEIVPQTLLKIIRYKCKVTSKAPCSSNLCSCKKHELNCLQSCRDCHGELCENRELRKRYGRSK